MADALGYDPSRSKVSDSTMTDFLRGKITGDVTEVPGIGPAAARALAAGDDESERVTNTFQLIGKVSSTHDTIGIMCHETHVFSLYVSF